MGAPDIELLAELKSDDPRLEERLSSCMRFWRANRLASLGALADRAYAALRGCPKPCVADCLVDLATHQWLAGHAERALDRATTLPRFRVSWATDVDCGGL